jgi:hydrogenase nickel incorporation protein HypB
LQVSVVRDILGANDLLAAENRKEFDRWDCFVVNLMSAPGAGKTRILEQTLPRLRERLKVGVIEGDVLGTLDADRLAPHGVPVVQIDTDPHFGGECHLDARMIRNALPGLPLEELDLILIENIGNLVCPAEFRVGEDHKVMVLSVAEGDDKPLKYPLMFRVSRLLLLNKIDLLGHVDFDLARFRANVARVNPTLPVLELSAKTGHGLQAWVEWLVTAASEAKQVRATKRGPPCGAI